MNPTGAPIAFVNPDGFPPPVGQYTNVAVVPPHASTVYVAGQLAVGPDGSVLFPGDFEAQAEEVLGGVARMLDSLGSSLRHVAFVRSFLVREEDFARLRDVRRRVFAAHGVVEPPPATTVIVSALYGGALLELDVVAVVDREAS